jgi:hypothetical protein
MTATRPTHHRQVVRMAGPIPALLVVVALVGGACGDPGKAAAGIVTAVDAPAGGPVPVTTSTG